MSDIRSFQDGDNGDGDNGDNGALIIIAFTQFEAQALANCIAEGIESLRKDSINMRGPTLLEITKAVAALSAILGRLMDKL